jgi:hypothetical protein
MSQKSIKKFVRFIDGRIRKDGLDPSVNCDVIVKGLTEWDDTRWRGVVEATGELVDPNAEIPVDEVRDGVIAAYESRHEQNQQVWR